MRTLFMRASNTKLRFTVVLLLCLTAALHAQTQTPIYVIVFNYQGLCNSCDTCKTNVRLVFDFLESGAGKEQLEHACPAGDPAAAAACEMQLSQSVDAFESYRPEEICQQLGACPGSPGPSNTGNALLALPGPSLNFLTGAEFERSTYVGKNGTGATWLMVHSTGDAPLTSVNVNGITYDVRAIVYPFVPAVTSVTPNSGPPEGGNTVTITGTNFTGATGVTFQGAAATSFNVVDNTTITATVPASAAGAASVIVTGPYGSNPANSLYQYLVPVPTLGEWGMIGLAALLILYGCVRLRRRPEMAA